MMQYRLRTLMTQFSIRDLLWLMLLAAVITCWYVDRRTMQLHFVKAVAEQVAAKEKHDQTRALMESLNASYDKRFADIERMREERDRAYQEIQDRYRPRNGEGGIPLDWTYPLHYRLEISPHVPIHDP